VTIEIAALCALAFLAGFIDSVVGGGGLVQLPALFVLMPGAAPASLLGTSKFAGIWGTAAAFVQYARKVPIEWRATLPTCATALVFAFIGARAATHIQPELMRPLVLALLVSTLAYTLWRKDLGALHAPRLAPGTAILAGLATGALIGFYDGFFGPGTGSFLIFAFVGLFGFSFLAASASAKLVNVVTNLAAVAWFIHSDNVIYAAGAPMALFNVAGSTLGSRLAIAKGSGFVRGLFLLVVSALILRFAWDLLR
jgi:uncharacterized membrane protein YfcA